MTRNDMVTLLTLHGARPCRMQVGRMLAIGIILGSEFIYRSRTGCHAILLIGYPTTITEEWEALEDADVESFWQWVEALS